MPDAVSVAGVDKAEFERRRAWGLETMLDLHGCDPALIRDEAAIRRFVVELCDLIGMRRFGDTVVVDFGEDERVAGYSMTQLIETSLISGHFANASNAAYINIFSCKFYEPAVAADFAKAWFRAEDVSAQVALRR